MIRNRAIGASWILVASLSVSLTIADKKRESIEAGDTQQQPDPSPTELRGAAYAHLMQAMDAVRRGEVGTALESIEAAIALQPESPALYTEAARILVQWTGRLAQAEEYARRAIELDPDSVGANRFLADLAAARAMGPSADPERRREALTLYRKVLSLDTEDEAEILRTIVQLQIDARDMDSAVADVRRLVEIRPGDRRAVQTLAQLLLRSGDEVEALRVILRYSLEHPGEEEFLSWAEQLATTQQAWSAVVEELDTLDPLAGPDPALLRMYGEGLLDGGRLNEAAEVLEAVARANPDDLRTRRGLAIVYVKMGRRADASELLTQLVEEQPDYPFLFQLLADVQDDQNDAAGAISSYGRALAALSGRSDAATAVHRDAIRQRIAALQIGREDFKAAQSTLDGLESADGPGVIELRCRLLIESENWTAARRMAEQLDAAGHPEGAALIEGEIALSEKKWSRAEDRFKAAFKSPRHEPYARVRAAELYRLAGRAAEGERLLSEWVARQPEAADAHFQLGVFYYETERFEKAEASLREAFRVEPAHAAALNFLGYSLAERNERLDEALEMIQRALDVDPWNGAFLDSLGWAYYRMARYDEARQPLESAAREMPRDPTVLEHLGDVYLALGERQRAIDVWARALDAEPKAAEAIARKMEAASATLGELAADEARDGKDSPR